MSRDFYLVSDLSACSYCSCVSYYKCTVHVVYHRPTCWLLALHYFTKNRLIVKAVIDE